MIANLEHITKLLNNQHVISRYKIAKETGVSAPILQKYANGASKIENMSLANAIKLTECYKNHEEAIKMENTNLEIIKKVENLQLGFEADYDIDNDNVISHRVAGEELTVYFAEKDFVQEAREAGNADELLNELNGLDDRFDYDKVIAYDAGDGIVKL